MANPKLPLEPGKMKFDGEQGKHSIDPPDNEELPFNQMNQDKKLSKHIQL